MNFIQSVSVKKNSVLWVKFPGIYIYQFRCFIAFLSLDASRFSDETIIIPGGKVKVAGTKFV
jgi:hypothetical protein